MNKKSIISSQATDSITISDLRDYYFENKPITSEQISALQIFDKYKVDKLSENTDDTAFQQAYFKLQIIENTVDYRSFLESIEYHS